MTEFDLTTRYGWGNEIHIDTPIATYVGSGRGYKHSNLQIAYMRPSRHEFFKNGWPIEIRIDGHCSTPKLQVGDTLWYKFDKDTLPVDNRLIVNQLILKVTSVRYEHDPWDMFFGKAILIEADGIKVKQKTLWNMLNRWYKTF